MPDWINKYGRPLTFDEIDDNYLAEILRLVRNGGGHKPFVNAEVVRKLNEEAKKRGIKEASA